MTSFFRRSKSGAKLGQHLLTSVDIAREVVSAANVSPHDVVLEVGPGKGMLTKELLDAGAHVVAVEKDPEMVEVLQERFAKEIEKRDLQLIEGDARTFLSSQALEGQYKVVANIPYYITGELIRLFLTAKNQPSTISLLVQKEVAERIARSQKESLLSLSVKAYGEPTYVRTVKAGSFNPPPNVDSAILAISDISRKNFADVSEEQFFDLLHAGFGQKRKTLKGNVKRSFKIPDETLKEAWQSLMLSDGTRAEDVSLEQWLKLSKNLQTWFT